MNFLQPLLHHRRESKPKVQQFICREDLNKKKPATAAPLRVKKKVHFESKPLIQNDHSTKFFETEDPKEGEVLHKEKSAAEVKILMRREEAIQLLSKCKNGGVLQFDDVRNVLVHIPNCRIQAFASNKKDD